MSTQTATAPAFTDAEIAEAQFALDHHPHFSPYWDSAEDVLEVIHALDLKPTTSEAFRRQWHSDGMRAAREEMEAV